MNSIAYMVGVILAILIGRFMDASVQIIGICIVIVSAFWIIRSIEKLDRNEPQ